MIWVMLEMVQTASVRSSAGPLQLSFWKLVCLPYHRISLSASVCFSFWDIHRRITTEPSIMASVHTAYIP